jgi:hypothetical protein
MYVYGTGPNGSGETYVINVHDRSAVTAFLNWFPKSSNWGNFVGLVEGSPLGNTYEKVKEKFNQGLYDAHNASHPYLLDAIAMSYMMNLYNMGVTLTRRVDNGAFKIINAQGENNPGVIIDITACD